MSELTPADDSLHAPGDAHRWWTETCWFSFDQPGPDLSGTFYPVFRPNLGLCSLAVSIWDASGETPWNARYSRALWHLPLPETDLADLSLEGLRYRALEPLTSYAVEYEDGDRVRVDLRYDALIEPHVMVHAGGMGHFDQPCRVAGEIVLGDEPVRIDAFAMRDRSWHVRDDLRSTRASYSYAIASAAESFLAVGHHDGSRDAVVAGYLLREGVKSNLVSGERRVDREPGRGWPTRVEIRAEDALGRSLEVAGVCRNRFANQATPGYFAWMSMTEWDFAGGSFGEDQDIRSPSP